jgi:DNA polymerase III delta subunit
MNKIKRAEKIHIDADAREFILNVCNNTAKILINYMEKFKLLDEPITLDLASKVCTNISFFSLRQYTQLLLEKKVVEAIKLIYSIYDNGYSVMDILDNYFLFIKTTELLNEDQKYKVIPLICKYITVFHNIHEDEIELSLFTNNMISLLVQ